MELKWTPLLLRLPLLCLALFSLCFLTVLLNMVAVQTEKAVLAAEAIHGESGAAGSLLQFDREELKEIKSFRRYANIFHKRMGAVKAKLRADEVVSVREAFATMRSLEAVVRELRRIWAKYFFGGVEKTMARLKQITEQQYNHVDFSSVEWKVGWMELLVGTRHIFNGVGSIWGVSMAQLQRRTDREEAAGGGGADNSEDIFSIEWERQAFAASDAAETEEEKKEEEEEEEDGDGKSTHGSQKEKEGEATTDDEKDFSTYMDVLYKRLNTMSAKTKAGVVVNASEIFETMAGFEVAVKLLRQSWAPMGGLHVFLTTAKINLEGSHRLDISALTTPTSTLAEWEAGWAHFTKGIGHVSVGVESIWGVLFKEYEARAEREQGGEQEKPGESEGELSDSSSGFISSGGFSGRGAHEL